MINALLPGLREFRADLVAGLLIGCIVISTGSLLAEGSDWSPSWPEPMNTLVAQLDGWRLLGVLGFLCYIAGTVFGFLLRTALQLGGQRLGRKRASETTDATGVRRALYAAFSPLSPIAFARIIELIDTAHASGELESKLDIDQLRAKAVTDVLWIEGKLVEEAHLLFLEYERVVTEGDFRVALSLLLTPATLTVSAAAGVPDRWLIIAIITAVLLSVFLLALGLYFRRKAKSLVAHAVADGRITPAILKRTDSQGIILPSRR